MKKLSISLVFLLFLSVLSLAQDKNYQDWHQKILEHKLDFYLEKLNLNSEKATLFERIYRDYRNERNDLKVSMKQNELAFQKSNITFTEMESIVYSSLNVEKEMVDLKRSFHLNLVDIFSEEEVINFYKAGEQYHQLMMERFRKSDKVSKN